MLTRIREWLAPPYFEGNEEKTNQARLMYTLGLYLVFALIIAAVIFVPLFVAQKMASWAIIMTLLVLYVVARHLLFRGKVNLSGILMVASAWALFEGTAIFGGGITSPMLFAVAAATIIIGLLFTARMGNLFVLSSILAGLGMAVLQESGFILPRFFTFAPMTTWFFFALALGFMNGTMNLVVRKLESALALARQQNEARQKAEATLRESEEKFRAQYRGIPIPTYTWQVVGDDLVLADCNNSAFEFTQGRIVNLIGKTASAIYHDDPETFDGLTTCHREKTNLRQERWQHLASTGEPKYLSINYAYVPPDLVMMHTEDITGRKRAEEQLRHLSTHDILTGIYNRAFFEEELARLERSREFPVSVIVADADNMKITNDTQGHAAGDELLRRATAVLQPAFRAADVLARIGGDEFAVLLPNTDSATAEQLLSRVRARLVEHNAKHPDLAVQLSLGAATAEQSKLVEAFTVADRRMYEDKHARKSKQ